MTVLFASGALLYCSIGVSLLLILKVTLSRYPPAIQGLCELFQPSGASGSYAQIFPTQTTYKQDICTYTRKKLTMIQKHSVAEMGFHESPLTSQPLFIKGLSRGEWSVG